MILAMVGGEIGGGYDVELADRAEEEAEGKRTDGRQIYGADSQSRFHRAL